MLEDKAVRAVGKYGPWCAPYSAGLEDIRVLSGRIAAGIAADIAVLHGIDDVAALVAPAAEERGVVLG